MNLSKSYLKEKYLKRKKKYHLCASAKAVLMEGDHVDFRLKIKFNCHLINIFCMRMSFLELLKNLRPYSDLGKIGFLFLELIFVKYKLEINR